MAYWLMALAAIVFVSGLTKLRPAATPRTVPWAPLLVWAILFAGGVSVWMMAAR